MGCVKRATVWNEFRCDSEEESLFYFVLEKWAGMYHFMALFQQVFSASYISVCRSMEGFRQVIRVAITLAHLAWQAAKLYKLVLVSGSVSEYSFHESQTTMIYNSLQTYIVLVLHSFAKKH